MLNALEVEKEIVAKGLNAPRVTLSHIDSLITNKQYYNFPHTTVTVCCITLVNGFSVTGESACASDDNFDIELGHKIAHDNAVDKVWALEGYLLKQRCHEDKDKES